MMPYYLPEEGSGQRPEWVGTTELAKRTASNIKTPTGDIHLHLLANKGRIDWVVRYGHSPLCKTSRCRIVHIHKIYDGN